MKPFLGSLLLVAYDWAPLGWAVCNGQKLWINEYQAVFALLGATYGGDGKTNFALPNLPDSHLAASDPTVGSHIRAPRSVASKIG